MRDGGVKFIQIHGPSRVCERQDADRNSTQKNKCYLRL